MKALFHRTYDYYELDNFVLASESYDKLKEYHTENYSDTPLISEEEYDEYFNNEKEHYCIIDIEVI
jgi:hypothetical protein